MKHSISLAAAVLILAGTVHAQQPERMTGRGEGAGPDRPDRVTQRPPRPAQPRDRDTAEDAAPPRFRDGDSSPPRGERREGPDDIRGGRGRNFRQGDRGPDGDNARARGPQDRRFQRQQEPRGGRDFAPQQRQRTPEHFRGRMNERRQGMRGRGFAPGPRGQRNQFDRRHDRGGMQPQGRFRPDGIHRQGRGEPGPMRNFEPRGPMGPGGAGPMPRGRDFAGPRGGMGPQQMQGRGGPAQPRHQRDMGEDRPGPGRFQQERPWRGDQAPPRGPGPTGSGGRPRIPT